jgi:hypothetical protein
MPDPTGPRRRRPAAGTSTADGPEAARRQVELGVLHTVEKSWG